MTRHRGLPASAVEQHAEALRPAAVPVRWLHRVTVGIDPSNVAYVELFVELAGEETAAAQDRIIPAQLDERLGKGQKLVRLVIEIPGEPGDIVILAIGVVVALLGPAQFVAAEQHRRALR